MCVCVYVCVCEYVSRLFSIKSDLLKARYEAK